MVALGRFLDWPRSVSIDNFFVFFSDDDDRQDNNQAWLRYFLQDPSMASKIISTRKVNGTISEEKLFISRQQ